MLAGLIFGCGPADRDFFASGSFEAVEVLVAAEAAGRILRLEVQEGQTLKAGQVLGQVDCQPLAANNVDLLLKRCTIQAPQDGVVLVKYAQEGEYAAPGKALFKLADTRELVLRAYVTAAQLSALRVGQAVEVEADFGEEGVRAYQGRVAWISDRAEFTPKTIQTRDERANLVHAVKVTVPNDGLLKLGAWGTIKQPKP
jgi:multidrug resistance efflux pump